jgi:Icc-related predicted phosphoesterase
VFIGATLWTDYDKNNKNVKNLSKYLLNDAKASSYMACPDEIYIRHNTHKDYIFSTIDMAYEVGCIPIVVTHHAPSMKSISKEFADNKLNHAFASDLADSIITYRPKLWIHGHTHHLNDYMIGKTRIISNPRGYPNENTDFNQYKVITC